MDGGMKVEEHSRRARRAELKEEENKKEGKI